MNRVTECTVQHTDKELYTEELPSDIFCQCVLHWR